MKLPCMGGEIQTTLIDIIGFLIIDSENEITFDSDQSRDCCDWRTVSSRTRTLNRFTNKSVYTFGQINRISPVGAWPVYNTCPGHRGFLSLKLIEKHKEVLYVPKRCQDSFGFSLPLTVNSGMTAFYSSRSSRESRLG